jgi:tRNA uridine 5-carboxymethylaminomethyl modification enzyme
MISAVEYLQINTTMKNTYDVVVIGAGHAGLESAFATAHAGLKTLLITLSEDTIASCPCNPSVGGPAKGIVTREIDALGGMQGLAADTNQLQIKLLNESKGAGVQALRAQVDKIKYHE